MVASVATAAPWLTLLACAAMLIATWRLCSLPLAATGLATLLVAFIWHHGLPPSQASLLDTTQQVGNTLWFSLNGGAFGKLFKAMLTTVLPVFLLGGWLAYRIIPSLKAAEDVAEASVKSRPGPNAAITAFGQAALPIVAAGGLIMMELTHLNAPTVAAAFLLPLGACLIDLWMMSTISRGLDGGPNRPSIEEDDTHGRPSVVSLLPIISYGGSAFIKLLVAAGTAGLIAVILDRTGLPIDLAQALAAATGESRLPVLLAAMSMALGLSFVLPAIAAYLIAVALLGPALETVGLAALTLHVFFLLACVGASVFVQGLRSEAMPKAGSGLAIVGIAFASASNPELLLVPEAFASVGEPDQAVETLALCSAILRSGCMLYLLMTAIRALEPANQEIASAAIRTSTGLAAVAANPLVHGLGLIAGACIIIGSRRSKEKLPETA